MAYVTHDHLDLNLYNIELGIDWASTPNADGKTFPLYIGILTFGKPAMPTEELTFNKELDHVCFVASNQTCGATPKSHRITGGKITFEKARDDQDELSPINVTEMTISPLGYATTEIKDSSFAHPPYWGWGVVPLMQLYTKGSFKFTVILEVEAADGSKKTFKTDPEMIVEGPTG